MCSGMTMGIKKQEEMHTRNMEIHFDCEDSQAVDQASKGRRDVSMPGGFQDFTIIKSPEQPVLT